MTDIRYYSITLNGRQLLQAETDEEAFKVVQDNYYLRRTTKRIVREVRETVFECDSDGFLVSVEAEEEETITFSPEDEGLEEFEFTLEEPKH